LRRYRDFSHFPDGGCRHLEFSKIRNFNGHSAVGGQYASSCQISSKSVKRLQRYGYKSRLTNTLPGPSASEVTTLWRYTNLFIIIFLTPVLNSEGMKKKLRYAIQKVQYYYYYYCYYYGLRLRVCYCDTGYSYRDIANCRLYLYLVVPCFSVITVLKSVRPTIEAPK